MRVALVANTAWLDENLSRLRRLVVGLIDEQVSVVQVLPQGLAKEDSSGFCENVLWRDSRWSLIRRYNLGRTLQHLRSSQVDLIHALDGRTWLGSANLAKQLGVPLVLEASSDLDVPLADRVKRVKGITAAAFVASTAPLAEAIEKKNTENTPVQVIRPGVHVSKERGTAADESAEALCVIVSGNGIYDQAYDAVLQAIQLISQNHQQTQFFFDGQDSDQYAIWQAAKKYDLLSNVSLVPRRLGHRELLLRADVLIHPQSLGRSRMLTLGAMAQSVPVIALKDPWLDYLIDRESAWIIDRPDPELWIERITQMIQTPSQGRDLAERARKWVGENHQATKEIDQTLTLYRQLTGESIKFPQGQP